MSKLGAALCCIYGIFALSFFIYGSICTGFLCGAAVVIPTLPWWLLMGDFGTNTEGARAIVFLFTVFIFYGLNAGILYLAGSFLERNFGAPSSK